MNQPQPEQNLTAQGNARADYRPMRETQEAAAPRPQGAREIHIRPVNHGYIVQIDCQTIAIESANKLIGLLGAYLTEPLQTEMRYNNGTLL